MGKKIPRPRKGKGASPKIPGHIHNDHGKAYAKGGKLYTHCTCGALVAVDDVEDTE